MISEHTPGPWSIHPAYIVCKTEMRTARNGWPFPRTRAEMIANANLIIAAPDMLEMLERINNEYEARRGDLGEAVFTQADIEKIRNVIKKARRGEVDE